MFSLEINKLWFSIFYGMKKLQQISGSDISELWNKPKNNYKNNYTFSNCENTLSIWNLLTPHTGRYSCCDEINHISSDSILMASCKCFLLKPQWVSTMSCYCDDIEVESLRNEASRKVAYLSNLYNIYQEKNILR